MTYREAREISGIDRLDAELLLAYIARKPRTWIIAHEEETMTNHEYKQFAALTARRLSGESVAHIRGEKEFYGRNFTVTEDTLIPRSSTEAIIEETHRFLREGTENVCKADNGISILSVHVRNLVPNILLDIGTGTGCIAITLSLEGWKKRILAIDTSAAALSIAKKNIALHACENITCIHADGAAVVTEQVEPFLVVSNPPYIPTRTTIEKTVCEYEPHTALFAGIEGTDVLLPLVDACVRNPLCMGIVVELQNDQVETVKNRIHSGMMEI